MFAGKFNEDQQVSPNDGLPDKICCDCIDRVRQSYIFKFKWKRIEAVFINSPNDYKYCTELDNKIIKTGKTKHIQILKDEQLKETNLSSGSFDRVVTDKEIFIVQEIKQEPEIEINIKEVDQNKKYIKDNLLCSLCKKIFNNEKNLKDHMLTHAEERPFQCELCPKNFRYKGRYMIHMRKTHADGTIKKRKFKCTICSKLLGHKNNLNAHMTIHTGEKPFKCKICDKKFRMKTLLTAHLQTAHTDGLTDEDKFKCTVCSRLFLSKSRLDRHMITHAEERPFQCEVCPKNFRFKGILTEHMQTVHGSAGKKKFKCTMCSRLWESQSHLKRHMIIHTDERPFQCEVCSKSFRFKSNLTSHFRKSHASDTKDDFKFECVPCSKIFENKNHLNAHMKIHKIEKTLQCKVCLTQFRNERSLKIHVVMAHADETTNNGYQV